MFGLNIFGSASPPAAAPDKASGETPVTNARVVDLKTLIFFGKLSLLSAVMEEKASCSATT